MLVAAAIVPGPPAFVAELMGSAAHELDDLRDAADLVVSRAVADLVAASADAFSPVSMPRLIVVGAGPAGEFDAAGPVSFGSFGRDVTVPSLTASDQTFRELPTPLMVARYLANRHIGAYPEHADLWASARWITTSGADATAVGETLREDGTPVALILVADGAISHGPKAPRAQDPRALAYEDRICAALASGHPGQLDQIDVELGRELGATGPQVWPVLVAAADGDGIGDLVWRGAPYGVGWAVAAWRRLPPPTAPVAPA